MKTGTGFSPWFRRTALTVIVLAIVNVVFILLALQTPDVPLTEWRKGPPIHRHSFYGPIIAPSAFWISALLILDLYALMAGILQSIPAVRRRRSPLLGTLLSLLSLAIALTVTETLVRRCARRLDMDLFRPHPDLFYWNKTDLRNGPDLEPVDTNSRGFRDTREVSEEKEPGEYRAFVVGDSSAFGHGVPNDSSFSAQLEPLLEEKLQRPVTVINAACPGHCTYEGLIVFRTMGIPLKPDLLIVSYNNDPAPEYIEEKMRAPVSPAARAIRRVLYRSDTYLLFQRTVQNAVLNWKHSGPNKLEPELTPRVSMQDYRTNLHAFSTEAAEHGCKVVYVKMPVNYSFLLEAGNRRKFYNPAYPAAMLNLCRESGYSVVNVDRDCLANTRSDVFLKGHHFHPGIEGHGLIAELLAGEIACITKETPELPAKPVINIGYSIVTPLHCAIGEVLANTGILAKHGLEGTFLSFISGKDQDVACREPWIDTTFSCETPAIVHLDKHPRFSVAGSPGILGEIALVVPEASSIETIADLRGRPVMIHPGASADLLLQQWLSGAGMAHDRDIDIMPAEGDANGTVRAILEKRADAAVLWDPWLSESLGRRKLRVVRSAPFWSVLFVDSHRAEAEPDVVHRTRMAVGDALSWASTNINRTVSWVSYRSCIPAQTVREVLAKNRCFAGAAGSRLDLGNEPRRRLVECEHFAKREGMVSGNFSLADRIRSDGAHRR